MSERSEEKQNILKIMFGGGVGRRHEGGGGDERGGSKWIWGGGFANCFPTVL